MAEEAIDFGNFSRKITVSPNIPLQLLNLKLRNSNNRIQATLLGKVYSQHIDILDLIPTTITESNKVQPLTIKVKPLDFPEHTRSLENILTVYPSLQIIGVGVTDLTPDISLALLHTTYVNKESGFKAQGILNFPIILSLNTEITSKTKNFELQAYSFSQTYRFCKDIMDVTAFEELQVSISLGEADFQSMVPLFEAFNDQEPVVPTGDAGNLMKVLGMRLKELKLRCDKEEGEDLKVRLREITSKIGAKQCLSTEELNYLLDLAGLQKRVAKKMNKIL